MNYGNNWDAIHPREPGTPTVTGAAALPPIGAGKRWRSWHIIAICCTGGTTQLGSDTEHRDSPRPQGLPGNPVKPPSLHPCFTFTCPHPPWRGRTSLGSLEEKQSEGVKVDLVRNAKPSTVPWVQPESELCHQYGEPKPEASLAGNTHAT